MAKSRIVLGLPEGGYMGLCVTPTAVFFASERDAHKHGRKPPFQTELPPGMASEVYDSPDKIPADFCSDAQTTATAASTSSASSTTASAPTAAAATAAPSTGGGGTMKAMDTTTCYYINGMIVCDG